LGPKELRQARRRQKGKEGEGGRGNEREGKIGASGGGVLRSLDNGGKYERQPVTVENQERKETESERRCLLTENEKKRAHRFIKR